MNKISIRFFKDQEVRAVWEDAAGKWWFCAVDIVAILSGSANPSNYWYVLKNRLKRANADLLTNCKGFKSVAKDGKLREIGLKTVNRDSRWGEMDYTWMMFPRFMRDGQEKCNCE